MNAIELDGLMGLGARSAPSMAVRVREQWIYIYIFFFFGLETLFATGLTTTPLVVQQHLRLAVCDNRYMKAEAVSQAP